MKRGRAQLGGIIPWGGVVTVLDVHTHFISEKYLSAIRCADNIYDEILIEEDGQREILMGSGMRYTVVDELCELGPIVAEMDRAGLGVSLLSPPPTVFHYELSGDHARAHAELLNDSLAESVHSHSGRFLPMGYVPLQDVELSLRELERCSRSYRMRAFHICSNVLGENLDSPRLTPFFEALQDLGALLLVHPWFVAGAERMRNYHLANSVGNPAETAIVFGSLVFGGVLDRFPDLNICLSHAGGAVPSVIGRMDRAFEIRPESRASLSERPSAYLGRFYYDTIAHSDGALRHLVDLVGWDRVLLGSDFPFHLFDMGDPDPVQTVSRALAKLPEEARDAILGANLRALVGV
jgi:aminocarboxymuconate-semialdehyde decarboxylase